MDRSITLSVMSGDNNPLRREVSSQIFHHSLSQAKADHNPILTKYLLLSVGSIPNRILLTQYNTVRHLYLRYLPHHACAHNDRTVMRVLPVHLFSSPNRPVRSAAAAFCIASFHHMPSFPPSKCNSLDSLARVCSRSLNSQPVRIS